MRGFEISIVYKFLIRQDSGYKFNAASALLLMYHKNEKYEDFLHPETRMSGFGNVV